MSRSTIQCPKCKNPVARKSAGNRVSVLPTVQVVIVNGEVRLKCPCGGMKIVRVEHERRAA